VQTAFAMEARNSIRPVDSAKGRGAVGTSIDMN
jgi:hypothetical protein